MPISGNFGPICMKDKFNSILNFWYKFVSMFVLFTDQKGKKKITDLIDLLNFQNKF